MLLGHWWWQFPAGAPEERLKRTRDHNLGKWVRWHLRVRFRLAVRLEA